MSQDSSPIFLLIIAPSPFFLKKKQNKETRLDPVALYPLFMDLKSHRVKWVHTIIRQQIKVISSDLALTTRHLKLKPHLTRKDATYTQ